MFETEELLVDEIANILESERDKLPKMIRHSNMKVLKEVNLGYGIADLVIALYENVDETRNVFLDSTQIRILSMIRQSPGITVEEIKNRTKSSAKLVTKSINVLIGEHLIEVKDGAITCANKYVTTLKNAIAIEAKLKNWKRALKQAYRYKWFSELSYVCLPSTNITPALSNLQCFKQMKVGLISVCKDNGFDIIYTPRPAKPICDEMNILLNECLLTEIYSS